MEMALGSTSNARSPVAHRNISLDVKGQLMGMVRLFHRDMAEPWRKCKGNKTDLVICKYDDIFLVMVTQIGSMGTILHARKEEGVSIDPTFSVSVIFGKRDEPLIVACGRQLIEHISSSGSSRSLVLSLGLKEHSMGTMKGIVSAVTENRLW